MSMDNKDFVLSVFRENGRRDALDLRKRAEADGGNALDGTAIIAEETKIPVWNEKKDYSSWGVGAPVSFKGNVFGLLQPHNAAHYPASTPENTPALWGVKHTKDPAKAKPYLAPLGTSGMYMKDECCLFDGVVYRCKRDNVVYSPAEYADYWEVVE